jgi:hypothetical protein
MKTTTIASTSTPQNQTPPYSIFNSIQHLSSQTIGNQNHPSHNQDHDIQEK